MNRSIWWPQFHDKAYKPTLAEQFVLHWQANLLMLRSPLALLAFFIIALAPAIVLMFTWWWIDHRAGAPTWYFGTDWGPPTALAIFAVYLVAQHFAFVQAMNRTYVPFVRRALWDRGIAVCSGCGQLLAPNAWQPRCSECGSVV